MAFDASPLEGPRPIHDWRAYRSTTGRAQGGGFYAVGNETKHLNRGESFHTTWMEGQLTWR